MNNAAKKIMTAGIFLAALSSNASSVFAQTLPPFTIPQPKGFGFTDIGVLISNAIGALLIIAAILAFIYLILGGISWITSGGDKQALETARNKITNAIVGLVIVAAAYAVMLLLQSFLGIAQTGIKLF